MGGIVSIPQIVLAIVTPIFVKKDEEEEKKSTTTVIAVFLVWTLVGVSLATLLGMWRRRKWRKIASEDVESQNHHQGVPFDLKIRSSPTPLLQQKLSSSPAASYHSLWDTGTSVSSNNTSNTSWIAYEELQTATSGFTKENFLGEGGFGPVFKGVLVNGREVAVKQMKTGSSQGEREFKAEIDTISRVHHRHLVSLVGYCINQDQRLLVYEFVSNQTLECHLHDKRHKTLEWSQRLKIALGSAKGLSYLHEDCNPKTIHRDIKSANILLDFDFLPKVADFGLAKQSSANVTHVSTRIMGTFGYLAPEYASSGQLTDKSDVYSFGVVLLELITGRKPVDTTQCYMNGSLVEWARPLISRSVEEDKYDEIVDPRLQPLGYNNSEMRRMVACAAACVRHSAKIRPPMSLIVKVLEGDVSIAELHHGVLKPGQSTEFSTSTKTQYRFDMEKLMNMTISSEDFSSNEQTKSEFSGSSISAEQSGR